MSSQTQNFITNARNETQKLWDAFHELKNMQAQWNALDYGNTLSDGEGANYGINHAQIGSAVFDAVNAIQVVLDAGNATNLAKLLY